MIRQCTHATVSRLRNDLYCVEWDVKLYYTILYYTIQLSSITFCLEFCKMIFDYLRVGTVVLSANFTLSCFLI